MAGLTLDAGALIAADRNDHRVWALLRESSARGVVPRVPAAALAQAWRGPTGARLSQALAGCEVEPLDETQAKETGELCARAGTRDVEDASVVVVAARRGDAVLTADPRDLRRLAAAVGNVGVIDLKQGPIRR